MRDPDQAKRRAQQAQRLLGDELFKECIGNLSEHYRMAWERTRPAEVELREECYRMLKLVDQFTGQLTKHLTTGEMVDIQAAMERAAEG